MSASSGMKLASPLQRGRTWRWRWSRIPAPADRSEIQAEVEALRAVLAAQGGNQALSLGEHVGSDLGGQAFEVGGVLVRRDHRVPGVVRVEVEQAEAALAATEEQVLGIVGPFR